MSRRPDSCPVSCRILQQLVFAVFLVVLKVELPGVKKEEISINIEDRVLTIKGEKKRETQEKKDNRYREEISYGSFKRSFSLSDDILTDDVIADYKDGMLNVTLTKNNTTQAVKQITIN